MSPRFRPHLETFEARIVPDGGYPGNPGGGYDPGTGSVPNPNQPNNPAAQELLDRLRAGNLAFAGMRTQYDQLINLSVTHFTRSLWHQKTADDLDVLLNQLRANPGADPQLVAAVTAQQQYAAGLAGSERITSAQRWLQADNLYDQMRDVVADLAITRHQLTTFFPGTISPYGVPELPARVTFNDIEQRALVLFNAGIQP